MKTLTEDQKSIIERFQESENELTYAQKLILKKIHERISYSRIFQDYEESYGSDYNDCHGDYYDADYN